MGDFLIISCLCSCSEQVVNCIAQIKHLDNILFPRRQYALALLLRQLYQHAQNIIMDTIIRNAQTCTSCRRCKHSNSVHQINGLQRNPMLFNMPKRHNKCVESQFRVHSCSLIRITTVVILTNIQLPSLRIHTFSPNRSPPSSPPSPSLLLLLRTRLHSNLILLLLLKAFNLLTIHLILSQPVLS